MSRTRAVGILVACSLLVAAPAFAKKKKKESSGGGSGEFQPEGGGGGEQPAGDQPSRVLERALKLYDGEDYNAA